MAQFQLRNLVYRLCLALQLICHDQITEYNSSKYWHFLINSENINGSSYVSLALLVFCHIWIFLHIYSCLITCDPLICLNCTILFWQLQSVSPSLDLLFPIISLFNPVLVSIISLSVGYRSSCCFFFFFLACLIL